MYLVRRYLPSLIESGGESYGARQGHRDTRRDSYIGMYLYILHNIHTYICCTPFLRHYRIHPILVRRRRYRSSIYGYIHLSEVLDHVAHSEPQSKANKAILSRSPISPPKPAIMLRTKVLTALQKTYDDSYLSCSTAVYYESQVSWTPHRSSHQCRSDS